MSDHRRQTNEDTLRDQRRDALRELAGEQLGETPPPPAQAARAPDIPEPPTREQPSPHSRRTPRRMAMIALIACVALAVLAGGGIFAAILTQRTPTAQRARAQPTASASCLQGALGSASATPTVTKNIRVSDDTYKAHSEPMLAVNPANPRNLVGGSKFFTDPAHYRFQIGTYTSFDGGCAWTDNGALPGFPANETTSDVSIAFGPDNRVYVAVLYTDNNDSGIAVSTSIDGGKTFGDPVTVYDNAAGAVFSDKPWLTVDMSNSRYRGSVYVVWSYDHGGTCGFDNACQQNLGFSRSTDGGKTFSPVKWVEGSAPFCTNPAKGRAPGSHDCDGALGAIPAVMSDGTLAVAFDYMDVMSSGKIPTRLAIVSSRDGGATWTAPTLIETISDISGVFPLNHYRVASLPAFAADPAHPGRLYIAWADKRSGDADILFSSSGDAGRSWSKPLRVNDDPATSLAHQFQPQLAVAPDGVVTISFFDTRLDNYGHLIDVYLAQSVNGGASFLPNIRVTTQSWSPTVDAPVDGNGLQFIGDYQGLAVTNQYAYPFWSDTRTGSQEIFTAAVPSAQPK